jgi:chemotaxis-related protein WspD
MTQPGAFDIVRPGAPAIDDCWNRIGVQGDKSCPLLAEHIHCRNCPVYAAAASRLLDRYSLGQRATPADYQATTSQVASRSLLIFRLGEEWLALATRHLSEVAPVQPIHSLPHQRSLALLGVANVRGALIACVALGELLAIPPSLSASAPAGASRIQPRMLIINAQGGAVLVPVDEVDGVHRIDESRLAAASLATSRQAGGRFTHCVLPLGDRSVRVLEEAPLLAAMARSLT